ncbi:hypothetical protein [Actinoplanes xinjiangensis]|uniref:Uncharacterized protein n=1 Tax=Actinoplanes xinjiangensis TaxID=512350 RepID=A0A316ENJ5_9ACTN|nr:hypothetical protein [Actinoplanes xinjiangensis]PWK33271.1 hypothetical protein BC793_12861 [Actinoplanes xinjiangensis]GIF43490.1 hypothetical protein Axi01nite_78010 [Actinoplanes xinjiangensis]
MRTRIRLQIAAIAVGAALTAVAGWDYSEASSAWQEAIRDEVTRAGTDQDDVRRVYANEGPNAYRLAVTEIRAAALTVPARTDPTARTQQEIAAESAFALRSAAKPGTLLGERRYDLPDGGSDLAGRLADVRASHAPPPEPDDADRKGDGLARRAWNTSVLTAAFTGLIAVGASIRRRRPAVPVPVAVPVEFVPQPALATPDQRRASYLLLIIWAAGVLIPFVQLAYSSQEQRYQADAARHSVQARSDESVSRTRTEFSDTAMETAQESDVAATARQISAAYQGDRAAEAAAVLAQVETTAAERSVVVAHAMARVSPETPLARALTTQQHDWDRLTDLSARETRRADSASRVANMLLALIALVALIGPVIEYRRSQREEARAGAAPAPTPVTEPAVEVAAAAVPATGPGSRFVTGLAAGSTFGMIAALWLTRRIRVERAGSPDTSARNR